MVFATLYEWLDFGQVYNMCDVIHVWHDSSICDITPSVIWRIDIWHDSCIRDMTHSYGTWLVHMRRDSSICACLFMCDKTHSYVTWLIHMWHDSSICDMTHMWHDSLICDMTHPCVTWLIVMWHDSFIRDMAHSYVTWLIHVCSDSLICEMTRSYRHDHLCALIHTYGVATISRLLKIIRLFCRISSL